MKKTLEVVEGHLKAIAVCVKHLLAPKDRMTLRYPEEELLLGEVYRGYMKLDPQKCVGCALCAKTCPANAIAMRRVEGSYRPEVNYARCIFCGFCVDSCPTDALTRTEVHDLAFSQLRDMRFGPERLSVDPKEVTWRPPRRVITLLSEEKGVRYARSD